MKYEKCNVYMSVSLCGVFVVSQQCLVGPFRSYVPEDEKN